MFNKVKEITLLHFKAFSTQGGCPWCGLKEVVRVVQHKGKNKYNCMCFTLSISYNYITYKDIFMAFNKIQVWYISI